MTTVNMHEAETRLSQLVSQVEAGEEVIIARDGKPVARLTQVGSTGAQRAKAGFMKGQIWISPTFDEQDTELERLFYDAPVCSNDSDDPSQKIK